MKNIMIASKLTRAEMEIYNKPDVVKKMRSSETSLRIFQKYGWNEMKSEFKGLF
jgi:hypothetical protein